MQVMADQLTQAGLPVPEGIDTEAMYQAAKQQCLATKARGPAAGAKPGKQVSPAAASKGKHDAMMQMDLTFYTMLTTIDRFQRFQCQ